VCAENADIPGGPYDLIFSRMTAEHFPNSANAYRNMFASSVPGGLSVHRFATLYTLPFLLNRVLPDALSTRLLERFSPRDRERHEKFKAYYSHCRGPLQSQIRFFRSLGYEVLEYRGYFGHNYYAKRLRMLDFLHEKKTKFLLRIPIPFFTSYATVILRRPLHKVRAS
jgi:hypothetical protein